MRRRLPGCEWLLLLLSVADWFALRFQSFHPPSVLALLVAATGLAFVLRLLGILRRLGRERRRWASAAAEMALLSGVVLALGGGMTNWLLGLQGAVILHEGESALLRGGTDLQHFEAGPLARLEEMELVLTLRSVELEAAGPDLYYPRSRLLLARHEQPLPLELTPRQSARAGNLRFFQGAFGFAPRIVILREERTLFDRVVPFLTNLHSRGGLSFEGRFTVESEQLEVEGMVDLTSLDEGMRGHATLVLTVRREGDVIGRGSLLPGHFATLDDGYRIGFAGLSKWSEIDIFRRTYTHVVLVGAAMALVGVVFWPLALWRKW